MKFDKAGHVVQEEKNFGKVFSTVTPTVGISGVVGERINPHDRAALNAHLAAINRRPLEGNFVGDVPYDDLPQGHARSNVG